MTKYDLTAKLAEAYYLKRIREGISGDAKLDWHYAEQAIKFFDKPIRQGDWWWEKDYEDFKWFESLYNTLTGQNNDREIS